MVTKSKKKISRWNCSPDIFNFSRAIEISGQYIYVRSNSYFPQNSRFGAPEYIFNFFFFCQNGSSTFEGNNQPGTKHRHLPRCREESQPWGKGSYSDLITMALASAPERKMTLDEIYRWITHNVPYFREKGGELTSSGWKVYNCSDYARQAFLMIL